MHSHQSTDLQEQISGLKQQIETLEKQLITLEIEEDKEQVLQAIKRGSDYDLAVLRWIERLEDNADPKQRDVVIYSELDSNGHNIFDVAAIHGHVESMYRLRFDYKARPSKSLFVSPTYDALSPAVKKALKNIPIVPCKNTETNEYVNFETELTKLLSFNDHRSVDNPNQYDMRLLKCCLEYAAAYYLNYEIEYLKQDGVTISILPIQYALRHCRAEVIAELMRYGAVLPADALEEADDNYFALKYLIEEHGLGNDARTNAKTLDRIIRSSLELKEKLALIEYLTRRQIDWTYESDSSFKDWTLIDLAVWHCPDSLPVLCALPGVNINRTNSAGFTALHRVAKLDKLKIAEIQPRLNKLNLLFSMNADPTIRAQGQTPLELAYSSGNHSAAYKLAEYHAVYKGEVKPENSLAAQLENIDQALLECLKVAPPFDKFPGTLRSRLDSALGQTSHLLDYVESYLNGVYSLKARSVIESSENYREMLNTELASLRSIIAEFPSNTDFYDVQKATAFLNRLCEQRILGDRIDEITAFLNHLKEINEKTPGYLEQLQAIREEIREHAGKFAVTSKKPVNILNLFVAGSVTDANPDLAAIAAYANGHQHRDYVCHMAVISMLEANSHLNLFDTVAEEDDEPGNEQSRGRKSSIEAILQAGGSPIHGNPVISRPGSPDLSSSASDSDSGSPSGSPIASDSESESENTRIRKYYGSL